MGLSNLILETVKKYLKGLEIRCQGLVTVTVTYKKRKINKGLEIRCQGLVTVTVTYKKRKINCISKNFNSFQSVKLGLRQNVLLQSIHHHYLVHPR